MDVRERPLAQRQRRQHLVGQQRGRLGHAPCTARGAEAPLPAAEGHQLLGSALLAANAQETLLQSAALQVRIELLLDVIRQRPTCFGSKRTKGGIVLLHQRWWV